MAIFHSHVSCNFQNLGYAPPATMVRYPLRKHPEVGVEESLASFAPATMG